LVFAPDEINDAIARAESLYYEAKFKESIQLLLRVDETLLPLVDSCHSHEKGELFVLSTEGESPMMNTAIRTAIQQWNFSPTVDQTGPRCVETEIPIVIKP